MRKERGRREEGIRIKGPEMKRVWEKGYERREEREGKQENGN